jgi:hypothetical protein
MVDDRKTPRWPNCFICKQFINREDSPWSVSRKGYLHDSCLNKVDFHPPQGYDDLGRPIDEGTNES